jgi:RHS repeat-associated protein
VLNYQDNYRRTLRDLTGKVLREYFSITGGIRRAEDYVYRDGQLLAAAIARNNVPQTTNHFSVDHLGTPRLITDPAGAVLAYHVYYPFGTEATYFAQDSERMKFTGHERDLASPNSPAADLDYMHARFTNPQTGRFLSTDSVQARPKQPQSWNRYAYTHGNPLVNVDPDGLAKVKVWEIGKYVVKQYVQDLHHGETHYHVFLRKGSQTLARVSMEGEVLTGSAPKSLLKNMAKLGLTTGFTIALVGVTQFFDAAPLEAQSERLKVYGIPEETAAALSQKLFGTPDHNRLSSEQFIQLAEESRKQHELQAKKAKHDQSHANESLDTLSQGGCFFNGVCP